MEHFLETIFSSYISDPKWYPFILIGLAIIALLLLYFLFSYIRSFIAWVFGVSELIRLQKETNHLLENLIDLKQEQNDFIYEQLHIMRSCKHQKTQSQIVNEQKKDGLLKEQHSMSQKKEATDEKQSSGMKQQNYQKQRKKKYFSRNKNNPE